MKFLDRKLDQLRIVEAKPRSQDCHFLDHNLVEPMCDLLENLNAVQLLFRKSRKALNY